MSKRLVSGERLLNSGVRTRSRSKVKAEAQPVKVPIELTKAQFLNMLRKNREEIAAHMQALEQHLQELDELEDQFAWVTDHSETHGARIFFDTASQQLGLQVYVKDPIGFAPPAKNGDKR